MSKAPTYQKVLTLLNDKKIFVIQKIYQMRCLSYEQIQQITYKNQTTNERQERKATTRLINELISYDCLEERKISQNRFVYFLKHRSINALLDKGYMEREVFDIEKKDVVQGYYRAHELNLSDHMIPHQLGLNQFILDVEDKIKELGGSMPYLYRDEQDVTKTYMFKSDRFDPKRPYNIDYTMKPDGMIELEEVNIIIEMDMGTESSAQLQKKWRNYHNYFKSVKGRERQKPLFVIFVLGDTRAKGKQRFENRKKIVWSSMYESLLYLNEPMFDIAVGTHDEMLELFVNRYLTQKEQETLQLGQQLFLQNKAKVYRPTQINKIDARYSFDYLVSLVDENEKPVLVKGRQQNFLVQHIQHDSFKSIMKIYDYFVFQHKLSLLSARSYLQRREQERGKIADAQRKALMDRYYRQLEHYQIVIVEDISKAYLQSTLMGLHTKREIEERREAKKPDGIFYTTRSLMMKANHLYEALFVFGKNDLIFFADSTLTTIKERVPIPNEPT